MRLFLKQIWDSRSLIAVLVRRELAYRFTGSLLGRSWLVLSPLIMLAIYAYFFGEILQAKWNLGPSKDGLTSFALIIFSGMILHQFLSECISRAPDLILANPNYVKKIVFPLEILPIVMLLATALQLLVSLLILIVIFSAMHQIIYWEWLFLPIILLPFFLVMLGVMWMLSALGVFLRDLRQITQFIATVSLFLSPVFYPMERLPDAMQFLRYINPLVIVIEESRSVLFQGVFPDWITLIGYMMVAVMIAWCGLYFFIRCKPAFADVI